MQKMSGREIKFRGKHIENGEWIIGSLIESEVIVGEIVEFTDDYFNTEFWYRVDPATVGQYTGLKDRNGKEMFEDDILKSPYGGIGTVKFHKSWGAFYYSAVFARDEDGKLVRTIHSAPFWNEASKYEVIGNAHENPELLEARCP